ncbi:hypothetical protein HDU76_009460, partial [Blyttiomyces sp. JEL0837]
MDGINMDITTTTTTPGSVLDDCKTTTTNTALPAATVRTTNDASLYTATTTTTTSGLLLEAQLYAEMAANQLAANNLKTCSRKFGGKFQSQSAPSSATLTSTATMTSSTNSLASSSASTAASMQLMDLIGLSDAGVSPLAEESIMQQRAKGNNINNNIQFGGSDALMSGDQAALLATLDASLFDSSFVSSDNSNDLASIFMDSDVLSLMPGSSSPQLSMNADMSSLSSPSLSFAGSIPTPPPLLSSDNTNNSNNMNKSNFSSQEYEMEIEQQLSPRSTLLNRFAPVAPASIAQMNSYPAETDRDEPMMSMQSSWPFGPMGFPNPMRSKDSLAGVSAHPVARMTNAFAPNMGRFQPVKVQKPSWKTAAPLNRSGTRGSSDVSTSDDYNNNVNMNMEMSTYSNTNGDGIQEIPRIPSPPNSLRASGGSSPALTGRSSPMTPGSPSPSDAPTPPPMSSPPLSLRGSQVSSSSSRHQPYNNNINNNNNNHTHQKHHPNCQHYRQQQQQQLQRLQQLQQHYINQLEESRCNMTGSPSSVSGWEEANPSSALPSHPQNQSLDMELRELQQFEMEMAMHQASREPMLAPVARTTLNVPWNRDSVSGNASTSASSSPSIPAVTASTMAQNAAAMSDSNWPLAMSTMASMMD